MKRRALLEEARGIVIKGVGDMEQKPGWDDGVSSSWVKGGRRGWEEEEKDFSFDGRRRACGGDGAGPLLRDYDYGRFTCQISQLERLGQPGTLSHVLSPSISPPLSLTETVAVLTRCYSLLHDHLLLQTLLPSLISSHSRQTLDSRGWLALSGDGQVLRNRAA